MIQLLDVDEDGRTTLSKSPSTRRRNDNRVNDNRVRVAMSDAALWMSYPPPSCSSRVLF
jgi:hypothetical protein